MTKRFTQSKKPLTLELIKGTLLTIADQMVTTIAEVILENAEHDKAGEYWESDLTRDSNIIPYDINLYVTCGPLVLILYIIHHLA